TAFRDSKKSETLGLLLQETRNPEIVLSTLDLFTATHDDFSRRLILVAVRRMKGIEDYNETYTVEQFDNDSRQVRPARDARLALLRCLEHFLNRKTGDEDDLPDNRLYLRKIFSELRFGDAVLTFNWDALAERTLGEMGLWNPTTGYGFDKPLARVP